MRNSISGLYGIIDPLLNGHENLIANTQKAIAGGASLIQYRDKDKKDIRSQHTKTLQGMAKYCQQTSTLFIINDDVELALATHANGVHLGRDDTSVREARGILGKKAIIGASCYNDLDLAVIAEQDGADYVAFGSFYSSVSKPEAVHADIPLLMAANRKLKIPVVAIGGITPQNGGRLINAGASALAVINGLFGQQDIESAARNYAELFQNR